MHGSLLSDSQQTRLVVNRARLALQVSAAQRRNAGLDVIGLLLAAGLLGYLAAAGRWLVW